jgi:hypothetical protein
VYDVAGAFHLGEALKLNESLQELRLSECSIGDDGVTYLAMGITNNCMIISLPPSRAQHHFTENSDLARFDDFFQLIFS